MANTLTAIMPIIYTALDVVSREMVGFIPAVSRNSRAETAAVGQTVTYPVVPAITLEDVTPGVNPADSGDQTMGSGTMTISASKVAPIRWTGEEEQALMNGDDPQLINVQRDQFAQAFRSIVNAVELDIAAAIRKNASRAYGTAGTAPFGTAGDLSDIAQIRQILIDNGSPSTDLQLVMSSAARASMAGKQSGLFEVNRAGTEELLRRGILGQLQGFDLHESAQLSTVTKGTGTSYQTNGAASIGATAITVDTGSGTIVQGDVITFAGDSNKYVVASALASNIVTIAAPGLKAAVADNTALTVGNNFTPSVAFNRTAAHLVTRAPAMPKGGDRADDVMTLTDPISGLVFQVARYPEYRRVKIEVGLAWGVEGSKAEHTALLLG